MEKLMYKPTSPNGLFVCMDAILKEEKWISRLKIFCLASEAGVDGNALFQDNPRNRTNPPTS